MFSKEESKRLTKLFWTSFGKYMGKHQSSLGKNIKWVNYKTGLKDIYFRLKADSKTADISIEIQHKDDGIRELFYDQFLELKTIFTSMVGEWIWEKEVYNQHGQKISRIYIPIEGKVNIYIKDTWKECFEFFEQNIVPLDEFWSEFNEIFKQLEK
ncbi:DUF4268 domain-containing protein [Parvicella tangerina]|uniref:DUF4268 domain-containing protein n=1 Tax=Parvicella tangerina TaxID=2829795 RepID=A0A916JP53_9FLAO|nr:DUF4268 domain-containing protein [Parvicella tangerina]CAG5085026.1 hypothetical protein CRYO30217_02628 [Parvicella tangerina]